MPVISSNHPDLAGAVSATDVVDRMDCAHAWHPFTQMREYLRMPRLQIERARGCWLYDTDGKRYLDANASIWTNVHGHNDPDLNAALREQLDKVAHATMLGLAHPVGTRLARTLSQLSPAGLSRVFFSDNGSNAVEIALKLSLQYHQLTGASARRRVIAMQHAYHGDTFGTMAVGDCAAFHGRFRPWCFEPLRFPAPQCHELAGDILQQDGSASLEALDQLLLEHGDSVSCLIMEPSVQGAAGMLQQPRGFTRAVAERCRRHGIHLILDEVFVGFGRLGPMLVSGAEGVEPDFLCLAKGLTGGYLPLAATLARESLFEAFLGEFADNRAFFHGHTFTGNPLAAAVSLRSIEKLEPMISSGALEQTIGCFGTMLKQCCSGHPAVAQVRQRGLAAAVDLAVADPSRRTGLQACVWARRHGLILRPLGDSLLIVPPLVISSGEIEHLQVGLKHLLDYVHSLG